MNNKINQIIELINQLNNDELKTLSQIIYDSDYDSNLNKLEYIVGRLAYIDLDDIKLD